MLPRSAAQLRQLRGSTLLAVLVILSMAISICTIVGTALSVDGVKLESSAADCAGYADQELDLDLLVLVLGAGSGVFGLISGFPLLIGLGSDLPGSFLTGMAGVGTAALAGILALILALVETEAAELSRPGSLASIGDVMAFGDLCDTGSCDCVPPMPWMLLAAGAGAAAVFQLLVWLLAVCLGQPAGGSGRGGLHQTELVRVDTHDKLQQQRKQQQAQPQTNTAGADGSAQAGASEQDVNMCRVPGCPMPGVLCCPECVEAGLQEQFLVCSQEHMQLAWETHYVVHTSPEKADAAGEDAIEDPGVEDAEQNTTCNLPGCDQPGMLACPTCLQEQLPTFWVCSQDHLEAIWADHYDKVHAGASDQY